MISNNAISAHQTTGSAVQSLASENSGHSASTTDLQQSHLAGINIVPAADDLSRTGAITQTSIRLPSESSKRLLTELDQTATKALKQNNQYASDKKSLKNTKALFKGTCPKGGYAQGFLNGTLNTITKVASHYVLDNKKTDSIKEDINDLKNIIRTHTAPDYTIEPPQTRTRRATNASETQPAPLNAGFDTEQTAKGIADILLSKNPGKIDLLKEVATPLIDHLSNSSSLYKRLPLIKAQVANQQVEAAKTAIIEAKPLFDDMVETYQSTKSSKALNAIRGMLACAVTVSRQAGDDGTFLRDILTPHQQSSSRTINREVRLAIKAALKPALAMASTNASESHIGVEDDNSSSAA